MIAQRDFPFAPYTGGSPPADQLAVIPEALPRISGIITNRGISMKMHRLDSSQLSPGFARLITEAEFQDWVEAEARKHGWDFYHTKCAVGSRAGYPDLHLVRGRFSCFAELKIQEGVLTAPQAHWQDILQRAGNAAAVWRPNLRPDISEWLRDPARYTELHGGMPHDKYQPDAPRGQCIICGKRTHKRKDGRYYPTCYYC